MPSPRRLALVAFLAMACHGAFAQTTILPTQAVERLAPQLVAFAGSALNFQNLVNGLTQGTPAQLVTVLPNGFTQVVTFTPAAAMSPADIARVLEGARQQLISLGIASPTAEQLGIALMGGIVPTALGGTPVAGALNPQNPPSPAAQIQANIAGGGAAGSTSASVPTPATPAITGGLNIQVLPPAVPATGATPTAPGNTSNSPLPAGATSRSLSAGNTSNTPAGTTPPPAAPSAPATMAPRR